MRRPLVRLLAIFALVTITAWACHDATKMVEPGDISSGGIPRAASMNIVPSFDVVSGGPTIRLVKVRAVVSTYPAGQKVVDTIANFDPAKNELQLEISVVLTEPTQQFFVKLSAIDANGDTVYKALDTLAVSKPSAATGSTPAAVTIPLTYAAPDTVVKTLSIAPRDTTIVNGDSVKMTAKGFKADNSLVTSVNVGWSVRAADTSKVFIRSNGTIVARSAFSNIWIFGKTGTGVADSTKLTSIGATPNLRVTSLTLSPNPILPNANFKIVFVVKNEGGPITDTTVTRIAVSQPGDTGDMFGIARRKLRALAFGDSVKDSVFMLLPPNATPDSSGLPYTLNVFADCKDRYPYTTLEIDGDVDDDSTSDDNDPNVSACRSDMVHAGTITETDETDNRKTLSFDIVKPDFIIDTITTSVATSALQRNSTVLLTYKVKNLVGNWTPRANLVFGLVDTVTQTVLTASSARPDSGAHSNTLTDTVRLFIPNTATPGKRYRLYGYVDCNSFGTTSSPNFPQDRLGICLTSTTPASVGEIPEGTSGETNNSKYIGGVEIQTPDLTYLVPAGSDTTVDIAVTGQTISFTFTLKNQGGNTGIGPRVLAALYQGTSTTPFSSFVFDTVFGPRPAGSTFKYTKTFTIPTGAVSTAQQFFFKAYIDCNSTSTTTNTTLLANCLANTTNPSTNGLIPETDESNNFYKDSIYVVPSTAYGQTNRLWHGKNSTNWGDTLNWASRRLPSTTDTIWIAKISGGNKPSLATFGGFNANVIVMDPGTGFDLGSSNILHITKALIADTVSNGTVQIDGAASIQGVLPKLVVTNSAQLAGKTVTTSGVEVTGAGATLKINGKRMAVTGSLNTMSGGILDMTNSQDTLEVQDSVKFFGGGESGKLTAGVLKIGGHLTTVVSTLPTFVSSGAHQVIFGGGSVRAHSILVGDTNHVFNKVDVVAGDTANFNTSVNVKGSMIISGVARFLAGARIDSDITVASFAKLKTDTLTIFMLRGTSSKLDLGSNGLLENNATIQCKESDGTTASTSQKIVFSGTSQSSGTGVIGINCFGGGSQL